MYNYKRIQYKISLMALTLSSHVPVLGLLKKDVGMQALRCTPQWVQRPDVEVLGDEVGVEVGLDFGVGPALDLDEVGFLLVQGGSSEVGGFELVVSESFAHSFEDSVGGFCQDLQDLVHVEHLPTNGPYREVCLLASSRLRRQRARRRQ